MAVATKRPSMKINMIKDIKAGEKAAACFRKRLMMVQP
jgi:hypothetical protein